MPTARFRAHGVALLTNVSATGSGSFVEVEGGIYQLFAEGTFGATVLTLDGQGPNDTTIASVAGVSVTAPTAGTVELRCARGERVRATLTGGSPSGVYVSLVRVQE